MNEFAIIILELALLAFALYKGKFWLKVSSIVHIFLVLSITRRLGNFFGVTINIGAFLYGSFFILQYLVFRHYGIKVAKETVYLTLYSVLSVVMIVALAAPLASDGNVAGHAIPIPVILRTIAILFTVLYFCQMVFLITLSKVKDNWFNFIWSTLAVQLLHFLAVLPVIGVKSSYTSFAASSLYIILTYPLFRFLGNKFKLKTFNTT